MDNFTSVGGRMVHWLYTLEISNQYQPFGVGLENYKRLCLEVLNRSFDPETFFLETYAISGIFALWLLLFFVVFFLYQNQSLFLLKQNL